MILDKKSFNTRKLGLVMGVAPDLYDLYLEVINKGGYNEVSKLGLWGQVGTKVGVRKNNMTMTMRTSILLSNKHESLLEDV